MTVRLTADTFLARTVQTERGCWEYQGKPGNRYGHRSAGGTWAHRFSYETFVGSIPTGFEIDHLCYNPPCVNPAHLEVVTHAENMRRAQARRLTCRNGHPRSETNNYVAPNGAIACRACGREKEARRRERIRAGITPRVVREDQHGTCTGYNYGCRCDLCRQAFCAAAAERLQRRGHPEIRPEQHGTRTGYSYGCRCDACRGAARAASRLRREQRKQLRTAA